jgi:DNA polymerase-1
MKQSPKSKLILIDGSALVYRAYYAFIRNPLRNSRGENTSAIFGVANSLLKILREQEFTHIAVCFDTPQPTFRHKMYAQYKGTREKMPDELIQQLTDIKNMIEAMGIELVEMEGFEADDVMATLSSACTSREYFVTLITWDKDFLQLLTNDGVRILKPARGRSDEEIITADVVEKKVGVPPEKIPDYLALVGDTSDNIPGIQGVGPKTAVKLLDKYGSVENIISQKENIKPKKVRNSIDEQQLKLSKKLVTLDENVELITDIESLWYTGMDKNELRKLFKRFEFTSLMGVVEGESDKEIEFEEFNSEDIKEVLDSVDEIVAIEYLSYNNDSILTLATPSTVHLTEIRDEKSFSYKNIHPFLKRDKTLKISTDVKSLLHSLRAEDICVDGNFFDISIASYLLDPSRSSHTSDFISLKYAGKILKKKSDLVKEFKNEKIDKDELKRAISICTKTDIQLYSNLKDKLKNEQLDNIYWEVEIPLVPVLAGMENRGIMIDRGFFESLNEKYKKNINEVEESIYNIAGEEFNVRSTKQLQEILFNRLKLKPVRRTKTGFSTDSESLLVLSQEHELPKEVLKYRELYKLKSTYIDTLPQLADDKGRIHTTFIQTTASTGRLASRNPNLQNIPAKGELGREIRKGFMGEKGWKLLSCDYSQIELRILAHISDDSELKRAFFEGTDIHSRTASSIFRIPEEDIIREMRRRAKVVNFGIVYGMSPYGLAKELNITPEEAMVIISSYFDTYKGVKEWIDKVVNQTREKGYTETLLGRKRKVPELESDNRNRREFGKRIAINTPIQGSAADIIKVAMIRIDKKLKKSYSQAHMLLQIHDELLFEIKKDYVDEAIEMITYEMEHAVELSVPLKVDVGVGDNWYEAH